MQVSDRRHGFSGTKAARSSASPTASSTTGPAPISIRPSLTDASGSGSRRLYSYRDLLELRVIKSLLDAGIKLESVRTVFEYLRTHVDTDIASAHLVISGSDVILCDGDELIDVMRRGGQGVLNVLALGGVKDDLDSTIVELADASTARRRDSSRHVMSELRAQPARRGPSARSAPRWCRSAAGRCRCRIRSGTIDEHLACRNDAVVFDVSHLGTVRVEGSRRRRAAAVRRSPTTSPRSRPGARSTRTCSTRPTPRCSTTSSSGGSTTRCSTSCPTPRTPTASAPRSAAHETTHDRAVLAVQGPQAKERLADGVPRGRRGRAVPRRPARRGKASTCVVAGTGYTGEAGVEIAVPDAAAADLWTAITGAGIMPAGLGARDTLRLEAGAAAARPRARAGHHPAAGRARLGRRLVQGRVPRPRAARRRASSAASLGC